MPVDNTDFELSAISPLSTDDIFVAAAGGVSSAIGNTTLGDMQAFVLDGLDVTDVANAANAVHTHDHTEITDWDDELDLKADVDHTHEIADTTGLQTALDGKSDTDHTHTTADITDLTADGIALVTGDTSAQLTALGIGELGLLNWDTGAAVDSQTTDLFMVARGGSSASPATNTGAQVAAMVLAQATTASISGLDTALDGKADEVHTHAIADVTDLQDELDGKAAATHTHAIADVTDLQDELDGKAAETHTHAISDITDLATELDGKSDDGHTHEIADTTGLQDALDAKSDDGHTHEIADVTGLQDELDGKLGSADPIPQSQITDLDTTLAALTIPIAQISDAGTGTGGGADVLAAADAAAIRTVLGLGSAALSDDTDFLSSVGPLDVEDLTGISDYMLSIMGTATREDLASQFDLAAVATSGSAADLTSGNLLAARLPTSIVSGTWTPTTVNGTNAASSTGFVCNYTRVLSNVMVSGLITCTPTAGSGTSTVVDIPLPIASNFTSADDATGTCSTSVSGSTGGTVIAEATNDRLRLSFRAGSTGSHSITFSGIYQIK